MSPTHFTHLSGEPRPLSCCIHLPGTQLFCPIYPLCKPCPLHCCIALPLHLFYCTITYSSTHSPLPRYNRARIERLRRAREEKVFEKIFRPSFWSYSKSMLKQPISVLEGERGDELEDTALKVFFTIQQHAGMCVCAHVCVCMCVCVRVCVFVFV